MKGLRLKSCCHRLVKTLILFFISTTIFAQISDMIVTVIDDEGPMVGVLIHNDDYSITGYTDETGSFLITGTPNENDVFTFSYLGYKTIRATKYEMSASYDHVRMEKGISLEEVKIIGRTDQLSNEIIHKVETISQNEILKVQSSNSADAIGQNAEVFIQKSQAGGGSPVIRGFEANKVLLVLDGVRMNNAIYRSGHLQNTISVDNAMLQSIEVIYGPGSLIYGSDALGGVIHFRSKNPVRSFDIKKKIRLLANANTSYASANNKKGMHVDFNVGGRKWGSLTSITFNDFGDLRAGSNRPSEYQNFGRRAWYVKTINGKDEILLNDNSDIQIGTGYKQYDVTQKFTYVVNSNLDLKANIQYSTTSDIPRYDALTEVVNDVPRYAEWNYGPQNRFLSSLQAKYKSPNFLFDNANAIMAYQQIEEDRITRRFQSENREHQEETVDVYTFTLDMNKYIGSDQKVELNYGLEYNYNHVNSEAYREVLYTGNSFNDIFTRYPSGGSSTDAMGAYILANYTNEMSTRFFGGLRYTYNDIYVKYDRSDPFSWPEDFYKGLSSKNQAITWSLGTRQEFANEWTLQALIGSAFRSPNVDDLAKIRINSDEVSVPNLDLKPEKSVNAELSVSKRINNVRLSTTGFYTILNDVIVREDFKLPDDSEFLEDEGELLKVVANVNDDKARIIGASFNGNCQISDRWMAKASVNIIQGRLLDNEDEYSIPLAHIPPMYGKIQLEYMRKKWDVEARYIFNGKKPIDDFGGSTDNPELATIDGTYAWSTFNMYGSMDLLDKVTVRMGVENLFDKHYRPFSSGLSGAGINFLFSVNYSLK